MPLSGPVLPGSLVRVSPIEEGFGHKHTLLQAFCQENTSTEVSFPNCFLGDHALPKICNFADTDVSHEDQFVSCWAVNQELFKVRDKVVLGIVC